MPYMPSAPGRRNALGNAGSREGAGLLGGFSAGRPPPHTPPATTAAPAAAAPISNFRRLSRFTRFPQAMSHYRAKARVAKEENAAAFRCGNDRKRAITGERYRVFLAITRTGALLTATIA